MNLCQLNTFFVLSSLLGGCNSKATRNPPKSDDRMKKIEQPVRVAFVQNPPMVKFIKRSIFQIFWRLHRCAKFLSFELETSNFGYMLIFWFSLTMKSFRKVGKHLYSTFYYGPPLEYLVNYKNKKHQGGDHCKLSNINVV